MVVRIQGTEDLQKVADALKEAADKDLQREVSAAIRGEAKPLGIRVLRRGAQDMPHSGGLADRVSGMGRVGVSASLRGRVASVRVLLRNKGVDLRSMDAGVVRHPVYGNRQAWVRQSVPVGAFTQAFEAEAKAVADAASKAAQKVVADVARKV